MINDRFAIINSKSFHVNVYYINIPYLSKAIYDQDFIAENCFPIENGAFLFNFCLLDPVGAFRECGFEILTIE